MDSSGNPVIRRRGMLVVLSSPSGAGKSTIAKALLNTEDNLAMSVSATTRAPREGEVEGKHYYFVSQDKFTAMVTEGAFLEHATVFGNSYGTPKAPVETALEEGHDVLFDVDWQGAQEIQQYARDDIVSIFVLPPSVEELEQRLRSRGEDSESVVRDRMSKASSEMSHWDSYDYVIINKDIDDSVASVRSILGAERKKRHRQKGLLEFVRKLGVTQ